MAIQEGVIQYTGKLGTTVGQSTATGRKALRVYRGTIKNPKSDAQNVQRMIFTTVAVGISYLAEILNNCLEGVQAGPKTLNAIRSIWLNMLRVSDAADTDSTYLYAPKGQRVFLPNPYLLSRGRLASPIISEVSAVNNEFIVSDFVTPTAALTASQAFPNVAVGDQMTVIIAGANFSVGDVADTNVFYCRFAIKDDTTPVFLAYGGGFKLNSAAIDLTKAKGSWDQLLFSPATGGVSVKLADPDIFNYSYYGAAILVSNIENQQRSTTYLTVNDAIDPFYELYHGGVAWPTYGDSSVSMDFASRWYLNNSARVASAQSPVADVAQFSLAGESLPALLSDDTINITGLPSMPTDLRLTAYAGGVELTCENLIGAAAGTSVLFDPTAEPTPAAMASIGTAFAADGDGLSGAFVQPESNVIITGGYAVCDGVTYTF